VSEEVKFLDAPCLSEEDEEILDRLNAERPENREMGSGKVKEERRIDRSSATSTRSPGSLSSALIERGLQTIESINRRYRYRNEESEMGERNPMNSAERTGRTQSSQFQELLQDLQSDDADTVAQAVRSMCPCRTAWNVPVQRYLFPMLEDAPQGVRHELRHVLFEDSNLGNRRRIKKMQKETEAALEAGDDFGPHGVVWYQRKRPRTKRAYYPPVNRRKR
jgi:hypothetical protein